MLLADQTSERFKQYFQPEARDSKATPVGFEPTRGDPIGLAGRRLSRSAKVSDVYLHYGGLSWQAQQEMLGLSALKQPRYLSGVAHLTAMPFVVLQNMFRLCSFKVPTRSNHMTCGSLRKLIFFVQAGA